MWYMFRALLDLVAVQSESKMTIQMGYKIKCAQIFALFQVFTPAANVSHHRLRGARGALIAHKVAVQSESKMTIPVSV